MSSTISKKDAIAQAEARSWYHRIQLYPDYVTKGPDQSGLRLRHINAMGLPANLKGKRVLDIGAWDGFYAFEMERRGAEVVALDHVESSVTGFPLCAEVFGSKATWVTANLYDLNPEDHGTFDIVFCLGVIYHLRHILLGLDRIRSVMKTGGDLYVETASIDRRLIKPDGSEISLRDVSPEVADTALLQLYPKSELRNDGTNFFAPNLRGFEALLTASEFKVVAIETGHDDFPPRALARARAVDDPEVAFYRDRDNSVLSQRTKFRK